MKKLSDARRAWRWFSVQVLAILAALPVVWDQLLPETHALVPETWRPWAISAVALAGIFGRLIDQGTGR